MKAVVSLFILGACTGKPQNTGDTASGTASDAVLAIVDPSRAVHYFDMPFPSDDLLVDGQVDLAGFPNVDSGPLAPVIAGWLSRIQQTTHGFANNGAAYFRFEAPLAGLPESTTGQVDDPVVWACQTDTSAELLPLDLRFITDPLGDPFWGENTLACGPVLGRPPRSGAKCAAAVMASAGARAPNDDAVPQAARNLLAAAGVTAEVAVATVFTVQDGVGQLQALAADVDTRLGDSPDWGKLEIKRVSSLSYSQGTTPSGQPATLATATFQDGSTETAYLGALEEGGEHTTSLGKDWPMAVYQLSLPTLNYSGLDDRPYMSPGLAHLSDTDRVSGWIDFADGQVLNEPDVELMRVTVSLPKDSDGQPMSDVPVIMWDHGTGGHAYNAVQRRSIDDDGLGLAQAEAAAGFAIIGRDAPLYGTRYPLIDEGYGESLGFYNIVNLPAFRDNQRQTAVDGHVLLRFIQSGLNDVLPQGSVDGTRVARAGHSLGSVTANLGIAMDPDAFQSSFLSGSGGDFSDYFLDTGLLGTSIDPSVLDSLFALFGVDVPDPVTPASAIGAALGLDPAAWDHIDRFHPAMQLFQWTMDPSDPMAVAAHEPIPATMIMGQDDWQVPNLTSEALCDLALPDCTRTTVDATGDYDPHYVLHRTKAGLALFSSWLAD
ncbi:MAG: hypothetical protein GXP62_21315 [Oligoflexia bacterium]|nr:hypothetical protein [Oligoflexia bacterium]